MWCKSILALMRVDDGKGGNIVLQGFLSGNAAQFIEGLDLEYMGKALRELLAQLLSSISLAPVPLPEKVVRSTWGTDEMSFGSFSTSSGSYEESVSFRSALGSPVLVGATPVSVGSLILKANLLHGQIQTRIFSETILCWGSRECLSWNTTGSLLLWD